MNLLTFFGKLPSSPPTMKNPQINQYYGDIPGRFYE
jgi:hypothetical protein